MRVGYAGGAGLAGRPAHHEPDEVDRRSLFRSPETPVQLLSSRQALLQVLVDDKVDHGLADAPPRGGETLPEPSNAPLRMNPSYHRGERGLTAIKLQPRLDQPDRVGGTRTHKP